MSAVRSAEELGDGPLAQILRGMLVEQQQSSRGQRVRKRAAAPRRTPTRSGLGQSKQLFLLQLQARGDVAAAARASGCTPVDVRTWQATDPQFARDFVLAIGTHIQTLRLQVAQLASGGSDLRVRERARTLLAAEATYKGEDGRLNARLWRDALAEVVNSATAAMHSAASPR